MSEEKDALNKSSSNWDQVIPSTVAIIGTLWGLGLVGWQCITFLKTNSWPSRSVLSLFTSDGIPPWVTNWPGFASILDFIPLIVGIWAAFSIAYVSLNGD